MDFKATTLTAYREEEATYDIFQGALLPHKP